MTELMHQKRRVMIIPATEMDLKICLSHSVSRGGQEGRT